MLNQNFNYIVIQSNPDTLEKVVNLAVSLLKYESRKIIPPTETVD